MRRYGVNTVRDRVIRQIRRGKKKWKEMVGYGKRWFGEYVMSKRLENMKKEFIFEVVIMNVLMCAGAVREMGVVELRKKGYTGVRWGL